MQATHAARALRPLMMRRSALASLIRPSSMSTAAARATSSSAAGPSGRPTWDIRMLYDGECPLCMKEVNFLRSRDEGKGKIDFVDIADPNYTAEANYGITFEQAMKRIHAVLADGTIVRDVEVFRRLYEAVGLGWVYAITKNDTVLAAANKVYDVWAKYRMEVTGREALEIVLEKKRLMQDKASCRDVDSACELPVSASVKSAQQ